MADFNFFSVTKLIHAYLREILNIWCGRNKPPHPAPHPHQKNCDFWDRTALLLCYIDGRKISFVPTYQRWGAELQPDTGRPARTPDRTGHRTGPDENLRPAGRSVRFAGRTSYFWGGFLVEYRSAQPNFAYSTAFSRQVTDI